MFEVVNALALVVMSTAVAYFVLAMVLGMREVRRQGIAMHSQSELCYGEPFGPLLDGDEPVDGYSLYFLIPCLNEDAVIARTVSALVDPTGEARVFVVDDGSDDRTGDEARSVRNANVTVLRRNLPEARKGKGAALNHGFEYLLGDVRARGLDPDRVIVVVMDADGRLSNGALAAVLPLFENASTGAVQLAVRIRNRSTNFLLQFQNHQFWTLSSLSQFGRISTSTVSLGGNGQFARLSALLDIGEQPWSASLTEDLDLSVSLAVAGWRLTSTPRAAVDQQGVETLGALIRQRTRWYQGHMTVGRRLPEIFASQKISHAAAVEMTLYLLVPWLFDLPWSILYHLVLIELFLNLGSLHVFSGGPLNKTLAVVIWYLVGFWPALFTAAVSKARDRDLSWARALQLGHAFVLTNYLSYTCAWRALYRMIRGRKSWTKTDRVAETPTQPADPVGGTVHA